MQLVFALIISLNGEEQGNRTSYWADINRCKYFSVRINKQAVNYYKLLENSPVKSYCIPIWVDPTTTNIMQ